MTSAQAEFGHLRYLAELETLRTEDVDDAAAREPAGVVHPDHRTGRGGGRDAEDVADE